MLRFRQYAIVPRTHDDGERLFSAYDADTDDYVGQPMEATEAMHEVWRLNDPALARESSDKTSTFGLFLRVHADTAPNRFAGVVREAERSPRRAEIERLLGGASRRVSNASELSAAVSASAVGDEIIIVKGARMNVSSPIVIDKSITIKSEERRNCLLTSANGQFFFHVKGNAKPAFYGLTFDGSGISYEGRAGGIVDWCYFLNFHRGRNVGFGAGTALGEHNNGFDPQGWYVTNNRFEGNGGSDFGGWGVGFWRGNGVWITDNEFINVGNGIKTNNGGATANDIHVERNYMNGIRRMNAEMQGQVTNFTLIDNFTEKTRMSGTYSENINNLGWSVIYHGDETRNVIIRGNIMYEPNNRADGTGVRICFEVGNGAIVEDNYVVGIGTFAPVFMGDSSGPRTSAEIGNTIVRNNRLVNVKNGQGYAYGQFPGQASFSNNTAQTKLSNKMEARISNNWRPGPGIPADSTDGGDTDPDQPTKTLKFIVSPSSTQPSDLRTNGANVMLMVTEKPINVAYYVFRAKGKDTLDAAFVGDKALVGGSFKFSGDSALIPGNHPAWDLDGQLTAYASDNSIVGSTNWQYYGFRTAGVIDPDGTKPADAKGSGVVWPISTTPTDPTFIDVIGRVTLTLNGKTDGFLQQTWRVPVISMAGKKFGTPVLTESVYIPA